MLSNPYTGIFEWFEQEEIEFEAMIEALNSFFSLYDSYTKSSERVDSLANDIKAFQFGQSNFKSIFTLKKKEDNLANLEEMKNQKNCPYCKTELVLRKGKNGEFYGCKNFPKCRYTLKK